MNFSELQWILTVLIVPAGIWLAKSYADSQDRFIKHLELADAVRTTQIESIMKQHREERREEAQVLEKMRDTIETNTRAYETYIRQTQERADAFLKILERGEARHV